MEHQLTGILRGLFLYEVAEEIDLKSLHGILGTSPSKREPAFRHPAPEYVRFEKPPVVERAGIRPIDENQSVETRIRYFEYGVASVELRLPFATTWDGLIRFAHRWITSNELEGCANRTLRERLQRTSPALNNPYETDWISEDYYVIQIDPVTAEDGQTLAAETLLRDFGGYVAQIVRGEDSRLSPSERQEVIQASMSYYPNDLLVVGWVAALVYDKGGEAVPTIDLLEYANSQLLEFRYYDDVLTDLLANVYDRLEQKPTFWRRWRLAREAENLNTIRLDYQELAERTDNAIKFLGDMFYARAYRLAATRIGVNDYRDLVTEKLNTARDLYESMVNEFHQGRAFFLEMTVVVILMIEIIFLFRGKG